MRASKPCKQAVQAVQAVQLGEAKLVLPALAIVGARALHPQVEGELVLPRLLTRAHHAAVGDAIALHPCSRHAVEERERVLPCAAACASLYGSIVGDCVARHSQRLHALEEGEGGLPFVTCSWGGGQTVGGQEVGGKGWWGARGGG